MLKGNSTVCLKGILLGTEREFYWVLKGNSTGCLKEILLDA